MGRPKLGINTNFFNQLILFTMVKNEKNLEYLQKLLGYLGFGDKLNGVLESAISRELPKFTLGLNNYHRPLEVKDLNAPKTDAIKFTLNFNRAKEGDTYFLNTYDVALHKNLDLLAPRKQTFDLERDHRITALQAYKLLSGMSFEKDIYVKPKGAAADADKSEKVSAWFKLNLDIIDVNGNHPLKTMRPEYGFNLEETLAKYPLKGFEKEQQRAEALKNLSNGNYTEAWLKGGKKDLPVLIAANPQMKAIDVYDLQLREIRDEQIWPERNAAQVPAPQKTTVIRNEPAPNRDDATSLEQVENQGNEVARGR
jgi:hypothetical protein